MKKMTEENLKKAFTVEGEAPDLCPICSSPKEKFVKF